METKNEQIAEFALQEFGGVVLSFVVIVIVIVIGVELVSDVQADQTINSSAYNTTALGLAGLTKFSSKLGLLATVIVLSLVLGIIVRYLYGMWSGGSGAA
jgi:NADH:ubiquinone oxidoreductase subunit 6 (subunit J)